MSVSNDTVSRLLMLQGIQDWGQSDDERKAATANYLLAAGFDVEPSGQVFFGDIVTEFTGPDAGRARQWLASTLNAMPRGKYEIEVAHLSSALEARQGAAS